MRASTNKLHATVLCLFFITLGLQCRGAAKLPSPCKILTLERRQKIARYVEKTQHLKEVAIAKEELIHGSCARKIWIRSSSSSPEYLFYLLTPDQRYLTHELADIDGHSTVNNARPDDSHSDDERTLNCRGSRVCITVFSDFQCPYCRLWSKRWHEEIAPLVKSRAILTFRNVPLNIHPWAYKAAELASCVALNSPETFWRVERAIFEHQSEITTKSIEQFVFQNVIRVQGFRSDQYNQCVSLGDGEKRVQQDMMSAVELGINGTPTVFVNGRRVRPDLEPEAWLTLISEAETLQHER